jgi:hypothetical protein
MVGLRVERSDRNPNCSLGKLLVSMKFFRRLERISKMFPAMLRRDIGRYERGLVGSLPGLGITTAVACFQTGEKWWVRRQLLKIAVRARMELNTGALSSSSPGAFVCFSNLMRVSTSSGRTSTTRESSSERTTEVVG